MQGIIWVCFLWLTKIFDRVFKINQSYGENNWSRIIKWIVRKWIS